MHKHHFLPRQSLGIDLAPRWYHFHTDASLRISFNDVETEAERWRYHGTGSARLTKNWDLNPSTSPQHALEGFYHIKKMRCSLLLVPLFIRGERSESISALSSYSPLRNAASLLQKSLRAEEMHYVFFFSPFFLMWNPHCCCCARPLALLHYVML